VPAASRRWPGGRRPFLQSLSQALLQEVKDWVAAEQALLDILKLDPANAEAKHNLEILRREHPDS
jgi:hypothetical protein